MRCLIAGLAVAVAGCAAAACTSSAQGIGTREPSPSTSRDVRFAPTPQEAALKIEGSFEVHPDVRYVCPDVRTFEFNRFHESGQDAPTAMTERHGTTWLVWLSYRGVVEAKYLVHRFPTGYCVERRERP